MAQIQPCDTEIGDVLNTGIESDCALSNAAGIIIVNGNDKWTSAEMSDDAVFIKTRIHEAQNKRFWPVMKGIFEFASAKESDVTEANPIKGTTRLIRQGGFTFTYTWERGGLCLASRLQGVHGKGYRYIPFDSKNKYLLQKNNDGTFSGLESTDITPNFNPATPTTSPKNILVLSTPYDKYVKAKLFQSDTDLTDLNGLIGVEIVKISGTTTKLVFKVVTECKRTDLVALYGASLAVLNNFIVKDKATGSVVTPTSVAAVGSNIEITGTFVTGQTYIVELAAPSILLLNNFEGYETVIKAEILIP